MILKEDCGIHILRIIGLWQICFTYHQTRNDIVLLGRDLKTMTFHKISNKEKTRDHLLENNEFLLLAHRNVSLSKFIILSPNTPTDLIIYKI